MSKKQVAIQVKVDEDVRENFQKVCKELGHNPSAWLRVQIDKLIKENTK